RPPPIAEPALPAANVWCAGYGSPPGRGGGPGGAAPSPRPKPPHAARPPPPPPPEPPIRRVPAVLGVLDLPDGEVGVLDRWFLGIWAPALADRLVVRGQLVEQDPEG